LTSSDVAPGSTANIDWPAVWRNSPEYRQVQTELERLAAWAGSEPTQRDPSAYKEFAASPLDQYIQVTKRDFEQYWRSPGYIYAKVLLSLGSVRALPLQLEIKHILTRDSPFSPACHS
jgi:hypothetical protein